MDRALPASVIRNKKIKRLSYLVLLVSVISFATLGLSRMKPAAPSVDRATVWIDTVKRGEMLREVRGPGSLVPEEVRVIAASTEGRVERILVEPGTEVGPGTVLSGLIRAIDSSTSTAQAGTAVDIEDLVGEKM